MTKLSWKTSKKIIHFKLYRSKIFTTQNFMLIPSQKMIFDFNHYILRFIKSNSNRNYNGNCNVNDNGNGNRTGTTVPLTQK